jgi:hypothetical protein
MADLYRECIFRNDRACCAAPYYGTADCEWAVDKDECPEPIAAISCIAASEDGAEREHELQEEVADEAHRIPSCGKEW